VTFARLGHTETRLASGANEGARSRFAGFFCRVRSFDLTSRAPNLLKRHLSPDQRLSSLQPKEVTVTLEIQVTPENWEAVARLTSSSQRGGITLYVEMDE
jgi:hypothetical protein